MLNLIEYSDNYADTTASLYHYKRPEHPRGNNNALDNVTTNNSCSFKCKSNLIGTDLNAVAANTNPDVPGPLRLWKNVKVVVPLKCISKFFRLLELPLINTSCILN